MKCQLAAGQHTAHPTSAVMTDAFVFPGLVFREAVTEGARLFFLWRAGSRDAAWIETIVADMERITDDHSVFIIS